MFKRDDGRDGGGGFNRNTQVAPAYSVRDAPREALSPRAAFVLAYDRLALLASASRQRSVVVAAVDAAGQVVASRRVFDREAVIVGRHERCGLRLPAESIALRQMAALVAAEGGELRIHVRDLATRQPFLTEDRKPSAGVTADGPLYLAIGEYAIWFVPSDALTGETSRGDAAWNALAPRSFIDRLLPIDAPVRRGDPLPVAPLPWQARGLVPTFGVGGAAIRPMQTRITHLAPPLLLEDGDAPEVAWGVLRIEVSGRKDKRWVSAERLERGLLLGRYDRCGVTVDPRDATTSRVHALMLRVGDDAWLIDLASTNGVRKGGARIGAEVLRDHDRISLGAHMVLGWSRTLHARA